MVGQEHTIMIRHIENAMDKRPDSGTLVLRSETPNMEDMLQMSYPGKIDGQKWLKNINC